jgi:hypothetical protein
MQIAYEIPMTSMIFQVSYQISTETLWYLHIYGIYNFATIYLWIPTRSTTLYDNYGLYRNFQSLLMWYIMGVPGGQVAGCLQNTSILLIAVSVNCAR